MRLAAAALVVVMLLPDSLIAQTEPTQETPEVLSEREMALNAFRQLVDRGEARDLFGLPRDTFWRRRDGFDVALLADDHQALEPVFEGAAAPFAAATGREIGVAATGPAELAGRSRQDLAPEAELVVVIAPRAALAAFAAANDFNRGMLAQFELRAWPFVFRFEDDERRRGIVLLADDGSARAREATFILATVWALGGVTLGPELEGLVSDSPEGPRLTPLGQQTFRLFYHQQLEVGMPIGEAVQRAEDLLPR